MVEPEVRMFFYGSYMNFDVLSEVQYAPRKWEIARLSGFQILSKLVHSTA